MSPYQSKQLQIESIDQSRPFICTPLFPYVVLKRCVNLLYPGEFDDVEFSLGFAWAKETFSLAKQKRSNQDALKLSVQEIEHCGFGKTRISLFSEHNIIIKNENSPIAFQYSKSIFDHKYCVDHFLAGYYSGLASEFFEKDVDIVEHTCKANGAKECSFVLSKKKIRNDEINNLLQQVYAKTKLSTADIELSQSIFTKKLFHGGNYVRKDGVIRIATILHVFFRLGMYPLSVYVLSKKRPQITEVYKRLGYEQCSVAKKFQQSVSPDLTAEDLFMAMLGNLNFFGYGLMAIQKRTKQQLSIQATNVTLLSQSIDATGQFSDPYLEGILLAMCEGYTPSVESIRFNHSSQSTLQIEITFSSKEATILPPVDSTVLSVMQERMKHTYYLSPSP